jgi:PIN domain nuclease of toxin-antitoxin system
VYLLDTHVLLWAVVKPELHKDPFDRILICQAIHEGLRLVTGDEAMRRYHEFAGFVW